MGCLGDRASAVRSPLRPVLLLPLPGAPAASVHRLLWILWTEPTALPSAALTAAASCGTSVRSGRPQRTPRRCLPMMAPLTTGRPVSPAAPITRRQARQPEPLVPRRSWSRSCTRSARASCPSPARIHAGAPSHPRMPPPSRLAPIPCGHHAFSTPWTGPAATSSPLQQKPDFPIFNRKGGLCGLRLPTFYTFSTPVDCSVDKHNLSPAKGRSLSPDSARCNKPIVAKALHFADFLCGPTCGKTGCPWLQ